jgi:glycosyltransferase involved in cell wall biosynthesis
MDFIMSAPSITVVLPVYNGGAFLGKAIESILNQTYRDFEFILINDGSKDGSKQVIDNYAAKDNRIIAVHQENAGLVTTLNRGIAMAKAPFIARMDADDVALPERFAAQIDYMNKHPEIAVLGTSIRLIDENDAPITDILYPASPKDVAKEVLRGSPLAHPTVMMRKAILDEAGGYNQLYNHGEDYELWLRLSEKYQMANLPEIYLLYRQHPHKVSFQYSRDQTIATFIALLASKARRQGKEDPTKHLTKITTDSLDLFPLTQQEKSRMMFQTFEFTLNAHIFNRDEEPVLEVIKQAREMVKGKQHHRFLSLILQKAALYYFIQRQYKKLLQLVAEAFVLSPPAFFETCFRLGYKLLKRIFRKVFK